MKKAIIILTLLAITTACSAQGDKTQPNMDSIKAKALCVLEETDKHIVYLTNMTRLVRKSGDELSWYAGGNELFLRYETWTISKDDKEYSIQNRSVLYCKPERIATPDGGSYDANVYQNRVEFYAYHKNVQPVQHVLPSGEWEDFGLSGDDGIPTKVDDYFHQNIKDIPVIVEDLGR
ncbi:hypothetical protein M2451_000917 [Dysgonomonas sp. PFB1-18]|uniref:hypothetical protein n=1 Tax=unclassified Dysgonomonas TaxID=2630389 RepID=UPI002474C51D|nr:MULTISPECIES: hypothetical protein [unclassified Dysgonomonas]MDH6308606.1 hypothetical protein [Dysgonomonas sp. PF1-14]MDH6338107.1 hypothetical protein [Dysgonomonas sp. PF1-16]MDH6379604.1 hypothetical protein [Dysgonomonas sp. PFB1-18]MDH6396934.1 hypothetical protein [Dysgonomonas sp. PF1-23]